MNELWETIRSQLEVPWIGGLATVVGSIIAAYILEFVVVRVAAAAARQTKTDLDDRLVEALRRPIFTSVILLGLSFALDRLKLPPRSAYLVLGILKTIAVVVWAGAAFRIMHELLQAVATSQRTEGLLQERTLPVLEIVAKAAVIGGSVYFMFLSWDIDVTAWLASAGIVGIAVGFAAKDSLANLFSGIFIIADAPFKIGDWIVLDGDIQGRPLRGTVSRIGMRSCRILTRDDLEITVPNALIANGMVINETGGPRTAQRSRVAVGVAYGSDVDEVEKVLLQCVKGTPRVNETPTPEVRFRSFGDSGLNFELLFWTEYPQGRGLVESDVNFRIYKALAAAGIEIPFNQHDLYLKSVPESFKLSG